jgi:hypothetical protein
MKQVIAASIITLAGMLCVAPADTQLQDVITPNTVPIDAFYASNSSVISMPINHITDVAQTEVVLHTDNLNTTYNRLDEVKNRVNSYAYLCDNWDLNGSKKPDMTHIKNALHFLDLLPSGYPIPKAMIGPEGIGLYWDTPSLYADIAFEGQKSLSLFTRNKAINAESFEGDININNVNKEWFVNHLSYV